MKIEYYHASVYGNGAMIAEEFKKQLDEMGTIVNIHKVRDERSNNMPVADLYLFSSPGRFGKPIKFMQNFLKKINRLKIKSFTTAKQLLSRHFQQTE